MNDAGHRKRSANALSPYTRIHKADLNALDWGELLRSLLPARNLLGDCTRWGFYWGVLRKTANEFFYVLQHERGLCVQNG